MPNSQGRFAWHELATTDPAAAATFYSRVTSWSTRQSDFSDTYTLLMKGATMEGGIESLDRHPVAEAEKPHWMPYVCVYDVDDSARQVKALGGRVCVGPREVPNVGGWAIIADPQGALVGMYEPEASPKPGAIVAGQGEFSWHELVTTDFKSAFDFYRQLFQWEKTGEFDMRQMGTYFMFGQRGQTYGGIFNRVPEMPPPSWLSYICVADVDATAETVKQAGGKVILGPMEVPGGDRILQGVDPQGAWFALHAVAQR